MNTHLTFVVLSLAVDLSLFAADDTTFGNGDELYRLLPVAAIVVQPDAKILVRDIGGLCRRFLNQRTGVFGAIPGGIFRFEGDGSVDHSFRCELKEEQLPYMYDRSLALQRDGKLVAFDRPGHVRRLTSNGKLDQTFAPQAAGTDAPCIWADPGVLRPFGLSPAGEILVRDDCTNWNVVVASGWHCFAGPVPVVRWFGSAGQFLQAASWTEQRPSLAAHLDSVGIYACRAYPSYLPGGIPHPTEVSYRPLETPLEEQLADPAMSALLRRITDELPLSLWRYAARLPDGGVVFAVDERNAPGCGRLVRFDREWRWDRGFIARFQLVPPPITLQLAPDPRGGLFVTGPLATLNGREFGGLAHLLPNGATDPAFQVRFDQDARQVPARMRVPLAIAAQPDGRVLVGGHFTAINGIKCSSLARLNSDGSLDRDFSDRFSDERFEEAKQRLSVSRLEFAVRPTPAGASTSGTAAATPESQSGSFGHSQTICVRQLEIVQGSAVIDFDGAPNGNYVLQAKDAVDAPAWSNIATNQADAAGRGQFKDASGATAPARFYRVLSLR